MNKSGILAATSGLEPNSPAKQHADNTARAASSSHPAISETPIHDKPLTASQALRQKGLHLAAIEVMAKMFGGKVVDLSHNAVIVEISGKTERVDAFLKLVRPYGILEAARSGQYSSCSPSFRSKILIFDTIGAMVMPRAPIASPWQGMADNDEPEEESEGVDSSLLPPG